jgi:hypothetical protein
MVGAAMWVLSFDLPRYRQLLLFLGGALACFGGALVFIDWTEGLPLLWKLWEGPFIVVVGVAIVQVSRRIPPV